MAYSTLAAPSGIGTKVGEATPRPDVPIEENGQPGRVIGELLFTGSDSGHNYAFDFVSPFNPGEPVVVPFEIVRGTGPTAGKFFFKLKAGETLDYEQTDIPAFSIKVTNLDETTDNTATRRIEIMIGNVVEAPTGVAVNGSTTLAITENAAATDLGLIVQTGGDIGDYAYTLISAEGAGNPNAAALAELFEISEGRLVQKLPLDRDAFPGGTFTFKIKAQLNESEASTYEQTITVTVNDENEAPTAIDFGTNGNVTTTVANNAHDGFVLATLRTLDPDLGESHTYMIVSGNHKDDPVIGPFGIGMGENAGKLVIVHASLIGGQTGPRQMWIRSTDASGKSVWQQITVNVNNGNETPTNILMSKTAVAENSAAGTEVGILGAVALDGADTFTFSLSESAGGAFKIENGKFVVADSSKLDYEKATSHKIKVKVTDAGGLSFEKELVIDVTDVAESVSGAKRNDKLVGGVRADILAGKAGKDTLTGGLAKDAFVFSTKPGKSNVDKITDFTLGEDKFYLDNAVFKKLGKAGSLDNPMMLKKSNFVFGSKDKDKNDYVGYDKNKGVIWSDSNGSAASGQETIAKLSKKLKMSFDHFFVV